MVMLISSLTSDLFKILTRIWEYFHFCVFNICLILLHYSQEIEVWTISMPPYLLCFLLWTNIRLYLHAWKISYFCLSSKILLYLDHQFHEWHCSSPLYCAYWFIIDWGCIFEVIPLLFHFYWFLFEFQVGFALCILVCYCVREKVVTFMF